MDFIFHNKYIMENKREENKISSNQTKKSPVNQLISLLWTLVTFFAIYLSFKCNNGFDLVGFLGACCCAPLYIAYKLAVGNCFSNNVTTSDQ